MASERPANMSRGWISPWNGSRLSADELIDEVALASVSRLYILSELGFSGHQLSIENDSVIIYIPTIDYGFTIYYPVELYDTVKQFFPACLLSLKKEYGIGLNTSRHNKPSGEKMGVMLRYFDSLQMLVRVVYARHCWDQSKILAIHGIPSSEFLSKTRSDLDRASIRYLVFYPLGENPGSGFFRTVGFDEAELLLKNLYEGYTGVVERCFYLEHNYGPHASISSEKNLQA